MPCHWVIEANDQAYRSLRYIVWQHKQVQIRHSITSIPLICWIEAILRNAIILRYDVVISVKKLDKDCILSVWPLHRTPDEA